MKNLYVLCLLALGCGSAQSLPATPSSTGARLDLAPSGSVSYGFREAADAGFVRVQIEQHPCGEGVLAVEVRLSNTGQKEIETYRNEVRVMRRGEVLSPTYAPYGSPCRGQEPRRTIAPGETTTWWHFYTVTPKDARVKVRLVEPDGLAEYVAVFHLDEPRVARASKPTKRAPAITPHVAVIDRPYYRITVVDKRSCTQGEGTAVGYEVLLENFSNVPLRLAERELVDGEGYRYEWSSLGFEPCHLPEWGPSDGLHEVKPGQRRRGWLPTVAVKPDAEHLELHGSVWGMALGGEDFSVAVGAVPPAESPPPVAAKAAPAPAPDFGPREAPRPMFKDLPIPTDPLEYEKAKVLDLVKSHHTYQGNFLMSVVPLTHQLWAAGFYPDWVEKRYDLAKMAELTREFMGQAKGKLFARLVLRHHGDLLLHKEPHSLTLPPDLAEYIFLEVDGAEAVRCSAAEVPLFGGLVGPFSKQVAVTLVFDLPKELEARLVKKGKARFVVGGLGFDDHTIHYDLPLSDLTRDAPAELQRVFTAAER